MRKIGFWKKLIIGNFILTLILFYWVYSQLTYLTWLIEKNLPVSIPETTSHSAIVINPMTGAFVLVNPMFFPGLIFLVILILILLYWFKY
jgi:hypothetical protein